MATYGKKAKKEWRYSLAMPVGFRATVEELALEDRRSLNQELVYLIEIGMECRKQAKEQTVKAE